MPRDSCVNDSGVAELTLSDNVVLQWLFSAVLLGLTATRLHYTLFLPPFDPLNNGQPFYDPIVAELLVTSVLALFWSSYMYVTAVPPSTPLSAP